METFLVIRALVLMVIALIFGFACNGDASIGDCMELERKALIDFKSGLNDPENRLSSWRGANCCQWRGITCDNQTGAVIAIDLHNPYPWSLEEGYSHGFWNLSGEIRPSLKKLKFLRHLDLSSNTFEGDIPPVLAFLESLEYLNLYNAGFGGKIPRYLGNLSALQYLDVSIDSIGESYLSADNLDWLTGLVSVNHLNMDGVDLSEVESDWLLQLNKLQHLSELHLSSCFPPIPHTSLTFVNLTSLTFIDLSFNNIYSEIPNWLLNVSSLVSIDLYGNDLRGRIPLGFSELPKLRYLNLGGSDKLRASCSQLLNQNWKVIEYLDISSTKLHGELPDNVGNMTSLRHLDLSSGRVEGGIPSSIGKLCNLRHFDMSGNNLTQGLPEFLQRAEDCGLNSPLPRLRYLKLSHNQFGGKLPEWLPQLWNLEALYLRNNMFEGPIPASLGTLGDLSRLDLGRNRLNGSLPDSVGQLSKLQNLDLSSNNLIGMITEVHLSKLRKLVSLHLSGNSFNFSVGPNWVPPFQALVFDLGSCNLGPSFPHWLQSQKEVTHLDISNASISGPIPNWFWDISGALFYLNFSFNQLQGQLPDSINGSHIQHIDLSSNLLQGLLPLVGKETRTLALSNNQFSGPIPNTIGKSMPKLVFLSLSGNQLSGSIPVSIEEVSTLNVLDFSRNNLAGRIPSRIGKCFDLDALVLQDNNLSGEIPRSLGTLQRLRTLHLRNNNISGKIPSSFKNLVTLETLDLGNNNLTGQIPSWFGETFLFLRILCLRRNRFFGELPSELSKLESLRVLDLAENEFNGSIPATFGKLKAMSRESNRNHYLYYGEFLDSYYEESFVVSIKGKFTEYNRTLSLLTSIDLSGNKLHGQLPEAMTQLAGLVVLNLSRNHIRGQIPETISRLHQLSSLDLSYNFFSGSIPPSMPSLDFLGYLNLSYNNLSGRIPYTGHMTTYDASSFFGNPGLCGAPLLECPAPPETNGDQSGNGTTDKWAYLSIELGFIAGILVPYIAFAIRRPWWDAYMGYAEIVVDRLSYLGYKLAVRCRNIL